MKQRLITGLLIVVLALPPILLGGWMLHLLVVAFAAMAVYEFTNILDKKTPWYSMVCILAITLFMSICNSSLLYAALSLFVMGLFLTEILSKEFDITKLAYLFLMTVMVSLAIRAFYDIYSVGKAALLFVAICTFCCDTFAYFGGRLFGKHKLIERISPNKTIEGAISGWIFGGLFGFVFAYFYVKLPLEVIVIASIALPVFGQIGDLAFSSIKRHFDQKDFGTIFPGHGGALDRIDSLLFCLLMFNAIIAMVI